VTREKVSRFSNRNFIGILRGVSVFAVGQVFLYWKRIDGERSHGWDELWPFSGNKIATVSRTSLYRRIHVRCFRSPRVFSYWFVSFINNNVRDHQHGRNICSISLNSFLHCSQTCARRGAGTDLFYELSSTPLIFCRRGGLDFIYTEEYIVITCR